MVTLAVTNHPIKQNVKISIEGLDETYKVGEKFSFHVKASGYGRFCGDPNVVIYNATNPSEILWSYQGQEFIGMCPLRDIQNTFGYRSISINQTGSYIVSVPFGDNATKKEFTVIPLQQEPSEDKKISVDYEVPDDFRASSVINGIISLDTQKNLYNPDLCAPPIEFKLDLSQQEKQQIWQSIKNNNFFELSDFSYKCDDLENCVHANPEIIVTLNITANGKTHSVTHHNSYIKAKNDNLDKFENIVGTLGKIVLQKNELNNFTSPRCGLQ